MAVQGANWIIVCFGKKSVTVTSHARDHWDNEPPAGKVRSVHERKDGIGTGMAGLYCEGIEIESVTVFQFS